MKVMVFPSLFNQTIVRTFMSKGLKILGLSILSAASFAVCSNVLADTASGTFTATASIISLATLTNTQVLNFGEVQADAASSGTAEIAAVNGARSLTSVGDGGNDGTNGIFTITNAGSGTVATVTLPAGSVDLSGPGSTMTVDTFKLAKETDSGDATCGTAINSNTGAITEATTAGTAFFCAGGTLHVGSNQTPGQYSGSYTVSVAY